MDLDLKAIRALASQTRIKILRQLLQEAATSSNLSNATGVAPDQLVMHLETLKNAGLVDTQATEDQLGHAYVPTEKARAIVSGQERKVRFSMGTATLSSLFGAVMIGSQFLRTTSTNKMQSALESTKPGATPPPDTGMDLLQLDPLLVGGILLILLAVPAILYSHTLRKLAP